MSIWTMIRHLSQNALRRQWNYGWGRQRYLYGAVCLLLFIPAMTSAQGTQPGQPDVFDEHDTRVFKAVACTKDRQPVEALYYIIASRTDLSAGHSSPSWQLMKDEVENSWRRLSAQLTMEQVMDERFADKYDALLKEMVPRLQQAVEQQSGVSIVVSEVNSRPMDRAKDQNVPTCSSPFD